MGTLIRRDGWPVEAVGEHLNPGWLEMAPPMHATLALLAQGALTPADLARGADYDLCCSVLNALHRCKYVRPVKVGGKIKYEVTPAGAATLKGS